MTDQTTPYPEGLQRLLDRLADLIDLVTGELEIRAVSLEEWRTEMERNLARFHLAAWMTGTESALLTTAEIETVTQYVRAQFEFLDNFALVIQSGDEWQAGWNARAEMYAGSIKAPYWKGKVKILPLPTMPSESSPCGTNCGCVWDVETIDEQNGDWDAYWVRGKQDSCDVCIQRATLWRPLEIRGGVLLGPTVTV